MKENNGPIVFKLIHFSCIDYTQTKQILILKLQQTEQHFTVWIQYSNFLSIGFKANVKGLLI